MAKEENALQRPSKLVPYPEFLASVGKGETTGWRWRRGGLVQTVNVCGKVYITTDEIIRFEARALAGEFSRPTNPPRQHQRELDDRGFDETPSKKSNSDFAGHP